jgi:hypothetical protein
MFHGLGVRDEDVELSPFAWSDARGRGDIHPGIADRGRDSSQCSWRVLHVDHQVGCHALTLADFAGG